MFEIKKGSWKNLVNSISTVNDVYAPIKVDKVHEFEKIKNFNEIDLNLINTANPIKRLFFKERQVLFNFKGDNFEEPKERLKNIIVFGVRKCDLSATKRQDMVFLKDPYYQSFRKKSLLIGLHCKKSGPHCFCGSMDLEDYGDLMFYEKNNTYLVESLSKKGDKFIDDNKKYFKISKQELTTKDRKIPNSDNLKRTDISKVYNHPGWEKDSRLCFSCAACNMTCPNCYCFNIDDHVEMKNLKNGQRVRTWSGCQLRDFTRVAGNYVFREDRSKRFKHRIYHQLQYFKARKGINLCTGCGRCITNCPTHIDWVKTLNEMK